MRLTTVRSEAVEFTGLSHREGPLALGQLNIVRWLMRTPDHFHATLAVDIPVPPGVHVPDVTAAVAVLVARHEGLRTSYSGREDPRQTVAASGVVPMTVCSLGEGAWGESDQPAAASALLRWLQDTPDGTRPAVRLVVAVAPDHDDLVVACAAEFSHLAVDRAAIEVLKHEFRELTATPSLREVGPPRRQPLDQAEIEATPLEQRRARAALAHLDSLSRRTPRSLYLLPGARATGESLAVEMSSPAAGRALRRIAARTRASRSSIVLAAVSAILSHRTGYRELILPLLSGNRFDRALTGYVGTLAQGCLAAVNVADRDFDALVKHTWTAVLEASRHGRYDAAARAASDERIEHDRGLSFDYDPLFNSTVPESWFGPNTPFTRQAPAPPTPTPGETTIRWRPTPRNGTPLRFGLTDVDPHLVLDVWTADTGLVPREEVESLLSAVERLLLAAAHADLTPARQREAIALPPITRPDNWHFVDNCWVDLIEVQSLVDDALAPSTSRILPAENGTPLVAHLTTTPEIRTPQDAHARCLAALPHHPAALTPRHYVLHGPTLTDPPLTSGTGR
ncbi:condensation domain-containing protein [Actinosynnema sp. CA-299493]